MHRTPHSADANPSAGDRPPQSRTPAPVYELSPRAIQCLHALGMSANPSLREVAVLMPALHLAATPEGDPGFNALFRMAQCDRTVVREIQHWLLRHGLAVES
jgi:hypothetical protein